MKRRWKPSKRVAEYLKGERQWKREHRIAHAQLQLRLSEEAETRAFWKDVLRALGARPVDVSNVRVARVRPFRRNKPAGVSGLPLAA
jgi:hypothetical protein